MYKWKITKSRKNKHDIFRIHDGDVFIGEAIVTEYPNQIRVHGVYTVPKFRRKGVATALMNKIIMKFGHKSLNLSTSYDLVSFYEKFGFKVSSTIPEDKDSLVDMVREKSLWAKINEYGNNDSEIR